MQELSESVTLIDADSARAAAINATISDVHKKACLEVMNAIAERIKILSEIGYYKCIVDTTSLPPPLNAAVKEFLKSKYYTVTNSTANELVIEW